MESTHPSLIHPSLKHPLIDATNKGKPAKKRKVQAAPSPLNDSVFTQEFYEVLPHNYTENQKQKAGGKENKKKEKPKGFILAVTSEPERTESTSLLPLPSQNPQMQQ